MRPTLRARRAQAAGRRPARRWPRSGPCGRAGRTCARCRLSPRDSSTPATNRQRRGRRRAGRSRAVPRRRRSAATNAAVAIPRRHGAHILRAILARTSSASRLVSPRAARFATVAIAVAACVNMAIAVALAIRDPGRALRSVVDVRLCVRLDHRRRAALHHPARPGRLPSRARVVFLSPLGLLPRRLIVPVWTGSALRSPQRCRSWRFAARPTRTRRCAAGAVVLVLDRAREHCCSSPRCR